MKTPGLMVLVLALATAGVQAAEPVRVAATKDNSIVLVDGEWRDNAGRQSRIRIKGNQHLVAMMFDRSALEGRIVQSATLVCQKADADIRGVTLSTIPCEWDEMKSNSFTSGMQAADGWGYPGARFPAITGGNAFSLVCQARSVVKDGAYHWEVRPDLVQALALGVAHGLTIHEWDADYSRNPTIFSREQSGQEPYLLVTFAPASAEPPPQPPTGLRLEAADSNDPASFRLHLQAPRNGFMYVIMVNGKPLPRWNIPFVRPGEVQVIPIRDVPYLPGDPMHVTVTTVGRSGLKSDTVSADGLRLAPRPPPFPTIEEPAAAGAPAQGLAVIPEEDKYDAAGQPVGDLPTDYLARNGVFDGRTIRLAAARGEVVGFQALLKPGAKGGGKVTVTCRLGGLRVEMYRAIYVACEGGRRIPDPLVPLGEVALSDDEAAPILVDIFVPFETSPRRVEGTLAVSDGRKVPIVLEVRDFAIPREANFACEMNAYGLPDKLSEFYRLQEIAYDHRVHANILAYSHRTAAPGARKCNMDMLMDFDPASGKPVADPRRMDERRYNDVSPGAVHAYWDDFAAAFGPYLSGQYFKKGHRGPVPAPGFYLTFHESWPLNVRAFFSGNPDAYEAFKAHPEYSQTFVNIMRDFVSVARRQGWTRTGFQVYLNNKGSLADAAKAPWTLDEPTDYWDYRALAYYADLTRQARSPQDLPGLRFRIDISRPEFDRGQLWGKADLWVVATGAFHDYHRLVADRAERTGERIWIYGTTNRVEESNRTVEAWALDAYRGGARGLVPWQTINSDGSAMTKADQLGLFIFTKEGGQPVIRHSMRLKAYRRAEQDLEYLDLARARLGLSPARMRAFVDHYVNLRSKVATAYAEDAGTPEYAAATPESLRQLREAAATLMAVKP